MPRTMGPPKTTIELYEITHKDLNYLRQVMSRDLGERVTFNQAVRRLMDYWWKNHEGVAP